MKFFPSFHKVIDLRTPYNPYPDGDTSKKPAEPKLFSVKVGLFKTVYKDVD